MFQNGTEFGHSLSKLYLQLPVKCIIVLHGDLMFGGSLLVELLEARGKKHFL